MLPDHISAMLAQAYQTELKSYLDDKICNKAKISRHASTFRLYQVNPEPVLMTYNRRDQSKRNVSLCTDFMEMKLLLPCFRKICIQASEIHASLLLGEDICTGGAVL